MNGCRRCQPNSNAPAASPSALDAESSSVPSESASPFTLETDTEMLGATAESCLANEQDATDDGVGEPDTMTN
jgi:hypothetical protein